MFVVEEHASGIGRIAGSLSYSLMRTLLRSQAHQAADWLKRFSPQLLHFHYGVDAAFFLPLHRLLSIPAIVSFYGYDVSSFPSKFGGLGATYLKRVFKEMELFLVMSEDMKKDLVALGAPAEKVVVHYYGTDVRRFRFEGRSYAQKSRFNILSVGTLEAKKGQHHLLAALRLLADEYPEIDFTVTFVGDGPLMPQLVKTVHEYHWDDRVTFTGHVPHESPELERYYKEADAFVLFCTTQPDGDKEGIPGTIVEAMASGLPIISTSHAGIPEIIQHAKEGILLEEGDVGGLKNALAHLATDENLRCSLGKAAATRALTSLSLEEKTRKLEMIYDSLIHAAHD
jgi:colanic acid/amylovoran biosynthesis glycosyltransferase